MSLSPAALALKDDLYLLTRLPLPKEADLDAIKERVFGSESGVPRTDDESKRRYVDAIVNAFDVVGVYRISDFPKEVENLLHKYNLAHNERDRLTTALRKLEDNYGTRTRERDEALAHVKRLQEVNDHLERQRHRAEQAGASFGVEASESLAEKDAEIARLRSDIASTRAAHAEITAAHAKLAADVEHKDRLMRDMNAALTHAREEAKTAHAALTAEQGRSDRLRAVVADLIADLNAAKEGAE